MLSHAALLPIFVSQGRDEGAFRERSVTTSNPGEAKEGRNPEDASALDGMRRCSLLTRNHGTNMLVGRALPPTPKPSCATWLGLSTGS